MVNQDHFQGELHAVLTKYWSKIVLKKMLKFNLFCFYYIRRLQLLISEKQLHVHYVDSQQITLYSAYSFAKYFLIKFKKCTKCCDVSMCCQMLF